MNLNFKDKTIVVWFSCGAASAVAAKETICMYGKHNTIRIVNNPIKEEDADNQRFLRDVEQPCTFELKKKARQHWESQNKFDYLVLGFTAEEQQRYDRFVINERSNTLPVLIDAKICKADCYLILQDAGLELPKVYKQGYPNANCIGCVKATSVTYWNHVRKMHPDVFEERNRQSKKIGCKLVRYKGKRMFLDQLPADAIGKPLKNLDFECGLFCDMK